MKRLVLILSVIATSLTCQAQFQPLKMWYDKPAKYFEESLPIGNGKLGACIFGNPDNNKIYLNDITFWAGKPVDNNENSDYYKWLPEIRKALFNEDYHKADSLQKFMQGPDAQFYMPLATLYIQDKNQGAFSHYYRELCLDNAICSDTYQRQGVTYRRTYFASNPDKLIAIKLTADKGSQINCDIRIESLVPHQTKASDKQITVTGHAVGDPQETIHFCSMLHVDNKGGEVNASDTLLSLRNVDEAVLYFVNETSYNGFDKHPVKEGTDYLALASDEIWHTRNYSFDEFMKRHVKDYQHLFGRFQLRLGPANEAINTLPTDQQLKNYASNSSKNHYLETLFTQYGRYLLISCSRTKGIPANLQGLWNPYLNAPWRSDYTTNINLEENYWPAEVSNLSELTMPLFTLLDNLSVTGKYVARNYYGINHGWCSAHNSDIWARANPVSQQHGSPSWANWNMGFAWLSQALMEHYRFNQDKQFLKEKALPLLLGASDFMCQWLIDNPKHPGELITAPSTSPENSFRTKEGVTASTCYGGTADLAIIRELFANTLQAAEECDYDSPLIQDIRAKLPRLHPYTIGHEGDLNEWYYDFDDTDIHHRHQSHLIGLYPGHHINLTTPDLLQAARRTLEIKGDKTTGWSTGWRINLWARLHDGKQAYHIFQKLLSYVEPDEARSVNYGGGGGTYPNLFDAHPPFQIDGNFGGTAGVCEMLVQSSDSTIELLPAISEAWSEGHVKGIRARGGIEIDMQWKDGKVEKAVLTALCDTKTTVIYNGQRKSVRLKKGRKTTLR